MDERKTILALGYFDGIHLGHAALIRRTAERAAEMDCVPAVLTFDTHPDRFVKGTAVELLNSAEDRSFILRHFFGVETVYYIHFNAEIMGMDWETFLDRVTEKYRVAGFVAGFDFRFGSGGAGDAEKLAAFCRERGMSCDVVPPVLLDGETVRSIRIREKLRQGELAEANALLGRPHLLTDRVRTGFRLGRTMDFPTVNMRFEDGVLIPRFGVYAARVLLPDGTLLDGVTNIGMRPTFHGDHVTVETNIFDFSADLYGQRLAVFFHAFLRPERPFASPEELREQIARDAQEARRVLAAQSERL